MKIKLFENFDKITERDLDTFDKVRQRIEEVSLKCFRIENPEYWRKYIDFDEHQEIYVDWSRTSMDSINDSGDYVFVAIDSFDDFLGKDPHYINVSKELILNPDYIETYYNSKKFNL